MKNKIKIINVWLIILSLIISTLIFNYKTMNITFINNVFSSMINHTHLGKQDSSVSNNLNYIRIADNTYTNASYCVYSPFIATVIEVNESSIVLKNHDNIYIFFENIININVKRLDYVNCDDILANFIDNYKLYFIKNNECLTYEEIFRNY